MINILYLHNSSNISGGERSLLQLWAELDRGRFRPFVVLPSEGPFAVEARRSGVEVAFWTCPSWRPWNVFGLWMARYRLTGILRKEKIALIHSYSPRNNLMAVEAARSLRTPVVWHERNLLFGGERDISRSFLSWPQALICNSRAVAARFLQQGSIPEKVRVIYNGVNLERFKFAADKEAAKRVLGWEGKKVVGVLTNLDRRKGVEVFLRISADVLQHRRDVIFVVVGGPYSSKRKTDQDLLGGLQREALKLGLGERVVWVGFQEDVRPFLSALDVACNVTAKEACSRAILESMATGTTVVAFDDGGNPELIVEGETGFLVPSGEEAIFAKKVIRLLDNDEERSHMGQRARARAETFFDARQNARETMELYEKLLG